MEAVKESNEISGEDFVYTLKNTNLRRALRMLIRFRSEQTIQHFKRIFVESYLILALGERPIRPASANSKVDAMGFTSFAKDTVLPVAQLTDGNGLQIFPVLTDAESLSLSMLNQLPCCIAVTAIDAMELFLASTATSFVINPCLEDALDLGRAEIATIIETLKEEGLVQSTPCALLKEEHRELQAYIPPAELD